MEWCPQLAMNAYLNTLHLSKIYGIEAGKSRIDEPKIMEFLSALAAGNGAKLIVQITSGGVTPVTLALAVAAKQTGGTFLCIAPNHHRINGCDDSYAKEVEQFVVAGDPWEILKQQKEIDFFVIDSKFGDHLKSCSDDDHFNPKGSVIVIITDNNLLKIERKRESSIVGEMMEKKKKYESVTLPVGEGIEFFPCSRSKYDRRKSSRFRVTYEY